MDESTLLKPAEAAARLRVSLRQFRRLGIPYVLVGLRKRYKPETLKRWMAKQERRPA